MDQFDCSMCHYSTNSQKLLNYHIVRRHKNDSNFHVTCLYPSCYYSSKSWCGLKSHFSRYHRQNVDIQVNELLENDSDIGHQIEVQQPKIKMECANFALKLQSIFKVPSSSIDVIIESTINLIQTVE